jgi:hypothetical protein
MIPHSLESSGGALACSHVVVCRVDDESNPFAHFLETGMYGDEVSEVMSRVKLTLRVKCEEEGRETEGRGKGEAGGGRGRTFVRQSHVRVRFQACIFGLP